MYRFTLHSPRFKCGERVTDGLRVGRVGARTFNSLLKRVDTDRFTVVWDRTKRGQFIKRESEDVDGEKLTRVYVHSRRA